MLPKAKVLIVILVVLLVSMNIFVEHLTNLHITGAEVLGVRSLFSLIFIAAYSFFKEKSLVPRELKLQTNSFFFSGLSLLLIMTGFEYISAGSVSTMQRMDIPLLIVIAAFTSKVTKTQLFLSLVTFAIIVALILLSNKTDESPVGYLIVFTGVVCVCINALLQKKISRKEEVQIIIAITSLSSLTWSLFRCYQKHTSFENIQSEQYLLLAMLGAFNVGIIFIMTQLYKLYKPDFVRYPFLLCTFLTMIVEMIVAHKLFSPIVLIGNTALLIIVTYLVKTRLEKSSEK